MEDMEEEGKGEGEEGRLQVVAWEGSRAQGDAAGLFSFSNLNLAFKASQSVHDCYLQFVGLIKNIGVSS